MSDKVYQILYCSRNKLGGNPALLEAEVDSILRSSQKNNAAAGVTGVLFSNAAFFAQVLEGSFCAVQGIFERLQMDPRHGDLVILQSGFVAERDFPDWSMGHVSSGAADVPSFAFAGPHSGALSMRGEKVLSLLRGVMATQDAWALPEMSTAVRVKSAALSAG